MKTGDPKKRLKAAFKRKKPPSPGKESVKRIILTTESPIIKGVKKQSTKTKTVYTMALFGTPRSGKTYRISIQTRKVRAIDRGGDLDELRIARTLGNAGFRDVGAPGAYGTGVVEAGLSPVTPEVESTPVDDPMECARGDDSMAALFQMSTRELIDSTLANPDEWLNAPNSRLGGKKPIDLLGTKDERHVRDMFMAYNLGLFL